MKTIIPETVSVSPTVFLPPRKSLADQEITPGGLTFLERLNVCVNNYRIRLYVDGWYLTELSLSDSFEPTTGPFTTERQAYAHFEYLTFKPDLVAYENIDIYDLLMEDKITWGNFVRMLQGYGVRVFENDVGDADGNYETVIGWEWMCGEKWHGRDGFQSHIDAWEDAAITIGFAPDALCIRELARGAK